MGIVRLREWLPQLIAVVGILALLVASAYAAEAVNEVIMDLNWLAPTLGTVPAIIASIVAAVMAIKSNKTSNATKTAVDGRMDEMLRITKERATAEATLLEKNAQKGREAAVAEALAASGVLKGDIVAKAEADAKKLVEEATTAAAKLVAEAHRVAVTNLATDPIPVQVVEGPGVDTPLLTKAAKKKPIIKRTLKRGRG